jgi:hypothetical protein
MKPTHTPPRSVRVPEDVWQAAKGEAERRGETVTDAIVRFLARYGRAAQRPRS